MRQVARALPTKEKESASPDVRTPEKGSLKKTTSTTSIVRNLTCELLQYTYLVTQGSSNGSRINPRLSSQFEYNDISPSLKKEKEKDKKEKKDKEKGGVKR